MDQKKRAPTEPGSVRRATARQYFRIKDDSSAKKSLSLFGRRVLLVLLCYAVLMPVSLFLVYLWLPHHSTPETKDYVYQIGPDGNYLSRKTYAWNVVRSGDVYYLDMNSLASYCDLTTTGDEEIMRYIVKASGETLAFVIGQSIAYINGIQERTGGNVYLRGGKVYVPLDFVNRCFIGVTATVDADRNKITIVRDTDENGTPATVSFPYKEAVVSQPIRFADLDADLQYQIQMQGTPLSEMTGFESVP